jgi:hypothetical protein
MTNIDQGDIIRDFSGHKARRAFATLNNAGEGFDPSHDIDGWEVEREAATTDDVAVYSYTDDEGDRWLVLVGTDGTGSDDSRWAVRVGDAGVDVE